jgi:hypothetical protein
MANALLKDVFLVWGMARACREVVEVWWTPGDVGLVMVQVDGLRCGWVALFCTKGSGACAGWVVGRVSMVVVRRDGFVVRLVISKRQVSTWLASLCVETEVGMGKKEWVWLLLVTALFVTWLLLIGPSALSAWQHALSGGG